jgi:hypothetical protein
MKFTKEEIKAMKVVRGLFREESRGWLCDMCPESAGEQSVLYTADCAADVLDELIAGAEGARAAEDALVDDIKWFLDNREHVLAECRK